ncbi:MAG: hypothetical protein WAT23_00525 [Chromatiaceae bacterium]
MKRLPLYLLALLASPVMAFGLNDDPNAFRNNFGSTNINEQRFENITYGSGRIGGETYNSTTQRFGNLEYQNGRIGNRNFNCTTQHLGGQTYTNCN